MNLSTNHYATGGKSGESYLKAIKKSQKKRKSFSLTSTCQ